MPTLKRMYQRLFRVLGPQHWWPATTPFEVMVGAVLTQNTNWLNVERAITKVKAARLLSAERMVRARSSRVERLIRSSGYFKQKAARLKAFSRWYLQAHRGSPSRMFRTDPWVLRRQLVGVSGIGPETADSILLYAGQQPVFVVDAYSRRIFRRHHLIRGDERYDTIQRFVMNRLPTNPALFNEFHALLVAVGKDYCHPREPVCHRCPLEQFPHTLR